MQDDLAGYLDTLEQGECYRVDGVLKAAAHELTERVFLIGADGVERGPYIRKRIGNRPGLGEAYERIWRAQQAGTRFMYLPRIIECSTDDAYRTVVMEYVAGQTLDDYVCEQGGSEELALRVFGELCDAVTELHERFDPPLIHRDLKPSNIIISHGNLTLIDFGIARTFDEQAVRDTVSFGTRGYAPPEQFGYGQTDERSDIYALGMLLAFCLLGEEPDRDLLENGFDDERIPFALRSVLRRTTAFDPQMRFSSARELRAAVASATKVVSCSDERQVDDATPASPRFESVQSPPPPQGAPVYDADTIERPRQPRPERTSFLSRIPRIAGAVWDLLICALWLCLLAFSLYRTLVPFDTALAYPLVVRAAAYLGIFTIGPAFLFYLALDKRPLRERSEFLAGLPRWKERVFCLAAGLGFIMAGLAITALFYVRIYG